jgi:hypothetical protein
MAAAPRFIGVILCVVLPIASLAFLDKLARARPARGDVYWPQTYGQSG